MRSVSSFLGVLKSLLNSSFVWSGSALPSRPLYLHSSFSWFPVLSPWSSQQGSMLCSWIQKPRSMSASSLPILAWKAARISAQHGDKGLFGSPLPPKKNIHDLSLSRFCFFFRVMDLLSNAMLTQGMGWDCTLYGLQDLSDFNMKERNLQETYRISNRARWNVTPE